MVNRGEIWWLEDEDLGRRPACVLTRQAAIPVLTSVVVATATRTIRGIDTELFLGPEDGMPAECVLSFDNLITVPKSALTERITRLSLPNLTAVCRALKVATGC